MKHDGGSGMVWGCISTSRVRDIVKIDGIMNAEKSRQILIHYAVGKQLIGKGFTFQHVNDPKNTANAVKSCLEGKTADRTLAVIERPLTVLP
ncbi:hypothetical protein LDENG_00178020 [Lucifuga dentata]|nr:hypothetical protein LDENG_00178020 [Lucifuga dentata]